MLVKPLAFLIPGFEEDNFFEYIMAHSPDKKVIDSPKFKTFTENGL